MATRGKRQSEFVQRASGPTGGESSRLMLAAVVCLVLGALLCAASAQSVLDSSPTAQSMMSSGLWQATVESLGGRITADKQNDGHVTVTGQVDFSRILVPVVTLIAVTWLGGAWWISRRTGGSIVEAAAKWGTFGGLWLIVGGSWELARLAAFTIGNDALTGIVLTAPAFWLAFAVAGWLATLLMLTRSVEESHLPVSEPRDDFHVPRTVWICFSAYVIVFVAMNWQLYRGLQLPHGDSAMYEEHLWNFLHGKGFRSYLDQGLFLGEHIQVIHLLLLPLYWVWQSQMLLEVCDSLILAAGCIPVFWMARRHAGRAVVGTWLAAAYLLYFPLQYLDIGIELKTFRPNALAVPVLLFALDQLERRRYKTFCALLLLTLSAQEDFAIVLAPLGVWIAARQWQPLDRTAWSKIVWRVVIFGTCVAALSVAYLVGTRYAILWFRNWDEIHYARYFAKFGNTLPDIGKNMLTRPGLLWDSLATPATVGYLLQILLPVACLPLFSPGRFAVGGPFLLTLLLNELDGAPEPRHHFHAPLVPIVFWSAAAGLPVAGRLVGKIVEQVGRLNHAPAATVAWWGRFAGSSALVTGILFGMSPLSVLFWDPYDMHYWRKLYVPDKRAELFARVLAEIPETARVASTDYIHPRFTHYARSYDYSDYPRAVNHYKPGVPDDTDYIVIDTRGRWSKIERPDQVREYREHPEQWELLPDNTDGYFIVLKRKRPAGADAVSQSSAK
jgi:uncharacterized membrane protein